MADVIDVQVASIYGAKTQQGLVELTINGEKLQMDLPKAREIVGMLQGAIEAAISDELMYKFLLKLGLNDNQAGAALIDFRELRQGSRGVVYPS
jgi:hypothetical protein